MSRRSESRDRKPRDPFAEEVRKFRERKKAPRDSDNFGELAVILTTLCSGGSLTFSFLSNLVGKKLSAMVDEQTKTAQQQCRSMYEFFGRIVALTKISETTPLEQLKKNLDDQASFKVIDPKKLMVEVNGELKSLSQVIGEEKQKTISYEDTLELRHAFVNFDGVNRAMNDITNVYGTHFDPAAPFPATLKKPDGIIYNDIDLSKYTKLGDLIDPQNLVIKKDQAGSIKTDYMGERTVKDLMDLASKFDTTLQVLEKPEGIKLGKMDIGAMSKQFKQYFGEQLVEDGKGDISLLTMNNLSWMKRPLKSIVDREAKYIDATSDTLIKLSGLSYDGRSLQLIVDNVNAYEKAGVFMTGGIVAVTVGDKQVNLQELVAHLNQNFGYHEGKLFVRERAAIGFSYRGMFHPNVWTHAAAGLECFEGGDLNAQVYRLKCPLNKGIRLNGITLADVLSSTTSADGSTKLQILDPSAFVVPNGDLTQIAKAAAVVDPKLSTNAYLFDATKAVVGDGVTNETTMSEAVGALLSKCDAMQAEQKRKDDDIADLTRGKKEKEDELRQSEKSLQECKEQLADAKRAQAEYLSESASNAEALVECKTQLEDSARDLQESRQGYLAKDQLLAQRTAEAQTQITTLQASNAFLVAQLTATQALYDSYVAGCRQTTLQLQTQVAQHKQNVEAVSASLQECKDAMHQGSKERDEAFKKLQQDLQQCKYDLGTCNHKKNEYEATRPPIIPQPDPKRKKVGGPPAAANVPNVDEIKTGDGLL